MFENGVEEEDQPPCSESLLHKVYPGKPPLLTWQRKLNSSASTPTSFAPSIREILHMVVYVHSENISIFPIYRNLQTLYSYAYICATLGR